MSKKMKPVVVCTEHRGVFFGYVPAGAKLDGDKIRLARARMCLLWSSEVKGVVGLASRGPDVACRIGPPAPALWLNHVTAVMEAGETAAAEWEKGYWA